MQNLKEIGLRNKLKKLYENIQVQQDNKEKKHP